MKIFFKRVIRKIKKIVYPQDETSVRRRKARKEGLSLRFQKEPFVFTTSGLKPKFYLPNYRRDYIQQRILTEKNYYEIDNLNFVCKQWNNGIVGKEISGGLVLDIGANIGNHTLYFLCECRVGCVHCFEPIPSTMRILKKNIEINELDDRVEFHPVAVSDKSGYAIVSSYDKNNIGSTSLSEEEFGDISTICIDDLTFDQKVNLIKIDVEGFELQVIKGCLKTIEKDLPYIMMEIREEYFKEIEGLLSPLGYQFEKLSLINYFLHI